MRSSPLKILQELGYDSAEIHYIHLFYAIGCRIDFQKHDNFEKLSKLVLAKDKFYINQAVEFGRSGLEFTNIQFKPKPFKMNKIENIAKVCHQANKAWCEVNGDDSQKDWDDAEEWQRESAINGIQFKLDNPTAAEDAQHNAWMADKVNAGWIFGDVKDAEAKTHPCIVPFEELPEFQQKKDVLFCNIVNALK